MRTPTEDAAFIAQMLPIIANTFAPEDVFSAKDLHLWAGRSVSPISTSPSDENSGMPAALRSFLSALSADDANSVWAYLDSHEPFEMIDIVAPIAGFGGGRFGEGGFE